MKVPFFLLALIGGFYIAYKCLEAKDWPGLYITLGVIVVGLVWYIARATSGGGGNDIDRNR